MIMRILLGDRAKAPMGVGEMPARGNTAARRAAIERLLRAHPVASQGELKQRLAAEGFAVTQSSLSRDLAELGAVRAGGRYVLPDQLAAASHTPRLKEVAGFILEVAAAGPYLLLVKTPAGLAASVALALDEARWPEVVGTVAGDDTFLVATTGRRHQARVAAGLEALRRGRADG